MGIAEHVLVEKGFAFVATRGPLSDVSTSFHGDKLVITTDVEASISQSEDRTLVESDEMGRAKRKDRDDPLRQLQPRMAALRADRLLMIDPLLA